jgi:hypothetical protein
MKAIVRRARIEHLAMELLRLSDALRLPVPVEQIYLNPPQQLWKIDSSQATIYSPVGDDPSRVRLEIARAIARLVGESRWETRVRFLGEKPFSPGEVEVFAIALLMPTALLAGLNERQRAPGVVETLFQIPSTEATVRLAELGYLSPGNSHHIGDGPTR